MRDSDRYGVGPGPGLGKLFFVQSVRQTNTGQRGYRRRNTAEETPQKKHRRRDPAVKQRRRNTEDYMSKRKIWTRRGCRIVLFVLTAVFMLYCLDRILLVKRTDGILTMQNFYAQDPGTVDVLILGSSHAGMNLDTGVLWEEEGIASYILWGSMQPFWNTYYFLQEALKTQTPDAVVLDVFAATYSFEYSDDARQVTNTAGMKPSLTKLKAIRHSAPRSRWIDLALGFPLYHDRYSEITAEDFQYFFWSRRQTEKKGCGRRFGTGEVTLEKVTGEEPAAPLYEKERQYLLEIIDLCSRRGIPLILINTPTAHRAAEQPYYQAVRQIAADTGVPYYNLNEMDDVTGITKQDYWTDSEHLNSEGAAKVSRWLAGLLASKGLAADRRGDPAYASWDENVRYLEADYAAEKAAALSGR